MNNSRRSMLYIAARSGCDTMIWCIFSILLIILLFLFVHEFILDFVNFELFSYLGEVIVDIFEDDYFVNELRMSEVSRIDGRSIVSVLGILVLGSVILPIMAAYVIFCQVVFSVIAVALIIVFLGYFVDNIVSISTVDFATSSLIEILGNKLFGFWMLVLSLIVFARSWRRMQATV